MAKKEKRNNRTLFQDSLKEAVRYAQGHQSNVKVEPLMIRVTDKDVKAARAKLGVSQPAFAALMGYSPEAVKKWEQKKNPVPGGVATWIMAIKKKPRMTKELLLSVSSRLPTYRSR